MDPLLIPCRATAMAGDIGAREVICIDSIQTPCLVWLLATVPKPLLWAVYVRQALLPSVDRT